MHWADGKIRCHLKKLEKAGHEVCGEHNHLCLFAGGGSYQRS